MKDKILKHLDDMVSSIHAVAEAVGTKEHLHGDFSFYNRRLKGYVEGLFELSELQIGDRARLSEEWNEGLKNIGSGWERCRHFLVVGAECTVRDIDYSKEKGGFIYDVVFDNESWLDRHSKEAREKGEPILRLMDEDHKHLYAMKGKYLEKIQ